ncbi:MAG: hypothetical protein IJ075_03805 [Lachnospiraceae bacterium]|nr:hypothetical protein [Lachnospiraceae bacterium]
MRHRIRRLAAFICCICILVPALFVTANGAENTGAVNKKDVIRLGYAESEEYGSFTQLLLDISKKLIDEGSIDPKLLLKYGNADFEVKFREGDTLALWNAMCDANRPDGRYQLTRDAFFNFDEMDESEYPAVVNRDDVDIMLSMGTVSGVYLAEHEETNKYMNMYSGDPIGSGIVKSETERTNINGFATVDTTPYIRQIDTGYKFLKFKKLGVVYEDSEEAYSYSAIDVIEKKAEEYGFEVVYEYVDEPVGSGDYDRYYSELKEAYRSLADQGIDCLYITIASIDYEDKMQELLDDAIIPAGIMTLAQDDFMPLPYGALFGVTINDCNETAAHVFSQIRAYAEEGVPFEELDMICETTPRIGVNYTTAKKIGFKVGFENLQMVDRVFR